MLEHCFICLSARVNSNSNLNSNRFSLVCFGNRKGKEIEEEKEEVNPTQQPSRAQFPFSSSGPTRPPSLLFGRPRTQTQFGPTPPHQARSDFLLFPFPRPTSSRLPLDSTHVTQQRAAHPAPPHARPTPRPSSPLYRTPRSAASPLPLVASRAHPSALPSSPRNCRAASP